MENKLWFRVRRNGYGYFPCSWQGIVAIILYVLSSIGAFLYVDSDSHSVSDTLLSFSMHFLSLTTLMVILSYLKGWKSK